MHTRNIHTRCAGSLLYMLVNAVTYSQVPFFCQTHQILGHLCQDSRALCHILKVLPEVECNAVNDDDFHLQQQLSSGRPLPTLQAMPVIPHKSMHACFYQASGKRGVPACISIALLG